MIGRRLGLALAVSALAAGSLVSSPASAAGISTTAVAPAAAHTSPAARKHKQKKLHTTLVITPLQVTAFTLTYTVLDKKNVPVPGVRLKNQYRSGGKWTSDGLRVTSDANGQFTLGGCRYSDGGPAQRLYSKATRSHKQLVIKYQLPRCGS